MSSFSSQDITRFHHRVRNAWSGGESWENMLLFFLSTRGAGGSRTGSTKPVAEEPSSPLKSYGVVGVRQGCPLVNHTVELFGCICRE